MMKKRLLIPQVIPCILHLEDCVGENLISVLLAMASNKNQQQCNTRSLSQFCSSI
jgi:hypothetical protein